MSENNQINIENEELKSSNNSDILESEGNKWGNLVEELEKSRKEINDIF
ncbi:MAG: hypothetical protein Q8K30_00630 [Candidatus Gracilibacteria bacterium]|nr:hypothetical protein [Candidatus Gracilibacteria bacterium]